LSEVQSPKSLVQSHWSKVASRDLEVRMRLRREAFSKEILDNELRTLDFP